MDPRYSSAFNRAITFVLPHECEYARGHWGDENFVVTENVSGDAGGLTKYGIDQASHRSVDVAHLDRAGAIAIYHDEWRAHNLDSVPERIAIAMFDVWVNGGHAVRWLQLALNKLCRAALDVDCDLGPATIKAVGHVSNEDAVLRYFMSERDARFDAIVAARPSQAKFLNGWKDRDRDLANFLGVS
jgi:lysozyme family protein